MSKALIAGINQVAVDKGLEHEVIFDAIEAALVSAYKRNYGSVANVSAEVDRMTGEMRVFAEKEVVEDVMNPNTEILLEEAKESVADTELGDVIRVQSTPKNFGRIAAQTAKQVILQRIREAERDTVYESFIHKVGEIINAQVRSVDLSSGAVTVLVGDKHESLLPREEQIPSENLRRGDYIRLYIVDVHKSSRGPVIRLSRTHRNLLRRLMEQEIPEVREGTVEIKAIAREPGARSKVAVTATVPGVDPVGSCVGMRGLRIQNIVTELAGEKIDIVEWSSSLRTYIASALSPAKVQSVILDEENSIKTAIVIVPDRQLSLAIGKEGQNARLAAKMTGWRIDIKSESEAREEGLDVLAAEQAQLAANSQDLLARAEQILRSDDGSTVSEDMMRRAAEAIQKEDAGEEVEVAPEAPAWPDDMEELPDETAATSEERAAALDAFDKAAAALTDSETQVPSFESVLDEIEPEPSWPTPDDLPLPEGVEEEIEEEALPLPVEETVVEEPEAETPAEEEDGDSEPLPQVITADMLRQRMAERSQKNADTIEFADLEVPEELLMGYSDDDDDDEEDDIFQEERKRNKARRGGTRRPAQRRQKTKRSRNRFDELDEEDLDLD